MRRFLVLLVTVALTACAAAPQSETLAGATQQCPIDGEANLDTAIHDYLVHRHPEVLMEASQALRQRQQAAQAAAAKQALASNKDAIYHNTADPVVGNPAGDVTVVEFFDAECPYCKMVAPDLARLYGADKGVRVVFKEDPILGPMSVTAAKAALAARKQGKYEAFHNALMWDKTPEHQLTEPHIFEIAQSVHLDLAELKRDMASPEIDAQIAANIALAHKLGITGTPGLIIGDQLVPGAIRFEALKQAVAEARTPKTAASE